MPDREAASPKLSARASPPPKRHSRSRSPRRQEDRRRDSDRGNSYENRDRDARNTDGGDRSRDSRRDRGGEDRPRPKRKNFGGFAYKDKRRGDDDRDERDDDRRGGGGGSSFRGYRNRSRSPRRRPRDDENDRRGGGRGSGHRDGDRRDGERRDRDNTSKPPKRAAPQPQTVPVQGFIVVYVNDRLGTKEAIPCLPSDTVGQFKILVASRIGRKPEEIKLQKQGERPLKDMITLADYEISNGRQLDLEVGTND